MPARTTTPTTPDIKLDWQQLINDALEVPGRMGDTYDRFYEYSFLNKLLLRMQGVHEPVATYKRWQSLGRQVVRGAKAKQIVRPIIIEKKDEAGAVTDKLLRFKPVRCLFTVSETEGDELPPFEAPTWDYHQALTALDITEVPFQIIEGNTAGYSYERNMAINPVAKYPNKTRIHEMGHILLGHTVGEGVEMYRTHRGLMEFQAEATSYLTLNELGMMPEEAASESRAYIQTWLGQDVRPSDVAIRQVFSVTDKLLRAGRPVAGE